MGHTLHRIKKMSPLRFPFFAASRALRSARTLIEKKIYSYDEHESRPAPKITPRSFPLVHQDALTPGFTGFFRDRFPEEYDALVKRAEKNLSLIVDLLGTGDIDLKEFRERSDLNFLPRGGGMPEPAHAQGRIPWHFDLKSGLGWDPKTFWSDIRPDEKHGADIKTPWELSRGAHLLTLAQAYTLTHEDRFAEGFVNQVEDWIRQNPYKYGVNWACPMDVGIRAANWIAAYTLLIGAPALTPQFTRLFLVSLDRHRDHLKAHLEWSADISTNHLLADLAGLFYLECFLGGAGKAEAVLTRFVDSLEAQIQSDGFCYEASTAYHQLDFEMALHVLVAGKRLYGKDAPESLNQLSRIAQKMGQWFLRLGGGDGRFPLVGDNDSGRFHEWGERKDGDVRFSANALALLTKDGHFKRAGWGNTPSLVWLFGFSGWETLRALPANGAAVYEGKTSSSFLRLRGNKLFFIMPVLPNGTRGVGNHTHNDKLSLLFEAGGEWFLTDPGMPAYTNHPADRDAFRKTRAHGTVEIDGEEQNRLVPGSLFSLENDARVVVEKVSDVEIQAAHDGYKRGSEPVVHRRKLVKGKEGSSWILEDSFEGKGNHRFLWSFPAGEGISIVQADELLYQFKGKEGSLLIQGLNEDLQSWIEDAWVSPAYGQKERTQVLRFKTAARNIFRASFKISWMENHD